MNKDSRKKAMHILLVIKARDFCRLPFCQISRFAQKLPRSFLSPSIFMLNYLSCLLNEPASYFI